MRGLVRKLAALGAAAGLVLFAPSCGSSEAPDGFSLLLGLDDSAEGATCVAPSEAPAPSCDDFALLCDAYIGFRVLEVDDDGASGAVLSSVCEVASSSTTATLCDLANLDVSLTDGVDLPRRLLRFEVAVWREEQLTAPGECPFDDVVFDLAGRPRTDAGAAVPAFGRRIELDLSREDPNARVDLACVEPSELADRACLPTTVVATLFDFDDRDLVLGDQLGDVTVALGVPERRGAGFVIEDAATQLLGLIEPDELAPFFRVILPRRFDEGTDVCILVTESVARTTTALTCLEVPAGDVNADVFLLRRTVLDALLGAADFAFPPAGLVVGRTVSATTGQPLADVQVAASDASVEVIYIDAAITGVNEVERTSASGYFVARDVPFGTTWTATGPGLELVRPVRGGVVENRVTLVNIELTEP